MAYNTSGINQTASSGAIYENSSFRKSNRNTTVKEPAWIKFYMFAGLIFITYNLMFVLMFILVIIGAFVWVFAMNATALNERFPLVIDILELVISCLMVIWSVYVVRKLERDGKLKIRMYRSVRFVYRLIFVIVICRFVFFIVNYF